jgi:hypothetical protein
MTSPELPKLTKEERDRVDDFVFGFFTDAESLMAVSERVEETIRRRRALVELRRRQEGECSGG